MSFLLSKLTSKAEVDKVIKSTEDLVLVLRFGREDDTACLQLDDILAKSMDDLGKMASIHCVDVDSVPIYVQYFDISLIPATVFFFNGQHIKVDWGTVVDWNKLPGVAVRVESLKGFKSPDHTKFIGSFKKKQDFLDVVEVIFRGAMKGKVIVTSPLDPRDVPHYELIYKDI